MFLGFTGISCLVKPLRSWLPVLIAYLLYYFQDVIILIHADQGVAPLQIVRRVNTGKHIGTNRLYRAASLRQK